MLAVDECHALGLRMEYNSGIAKKGEHIPADLQQAAGASGDGGEVGAVVPMQQRIVAYARPRRDFTLKRLTACPHTCTALQNQREGIALLPAAVKYSV